MTTQPAASPASQLIRRAREAKGLSPEQAAELLPASIAIKGGRWRQIEQGYVAKKGRRVPTEADDMLLAHMANVVGVTPDELIIEGRAGAGEVLRRIRDQVGGPGKRKLIEDLRGNPDFMRVWNRLPPALQQQALRQAEDLQRRIDEEEERAREQKERTKSDLVRYVEALATPGESGA